MQKFRTALGKLSEGLDNMMVGLVFVIVALMVVTTTAQVFFRVLFNALTWSEELSRYLLVWGTFFGATLAYKRGNHIAVTFIIDFFPTKLRIWFNIFSYVLSIAFFAIVSYMGIQMIQMQVFQISPALSLPMHMVYWAIPASLLIMTVHALAGIAEEFDKAAGKEVAS